jgi:hypothetical protein
MGIDIALTSEGSIRVECGEEVLEVPLHRLILRGRDANSTSASSPRRLVPDSTSGKVADKNILSGGSGSKAEPPPGGRPSNGPSAGRPSNGPTIAGIVASRTSGSLPPDAFTLEQSNSPQSCEWLSELASMDFETAYEQIAQLKQDRASGAHFFIDVRMAPRTAPEKFHIAGLHRFLLDSDLGVTGFRLLLDPNDE